MYAINENDLDKTYRFAEFDMVNYELKEIRNYQSETGDWAALMCSPQGQVYGITRAGSLMKINKVTGEYKEVGSTGLICSKLTAGTIDPESGRCLFVNITESTSAMYEINLETAEATYLFDMPGNAQVLSLYVPDYVAPATAPKSPTDLALNFEGASLSGNVTFTMPSETMNGNALSGQVAYTAYLNNEQFAAATAAAGAAVSLPLTVETSGSYTVSVTAGTDGDMSEKAYATRWLGNDIPKTASSVKLTQQEGKLVLEWKAPTAGTQNAAFDPTALTYDITAYPSGEVVATGLTDLKYEADVPEVEEFTRVGFGVTTVLGDSKSIEERSNDVILGYLAAPFTTDFSNQNCMDLLTIINANDDYSTWKYEYTVMDNGRLIINYSYYYDMDDWIVLHPIYLEGGFTYSIGCTATATTNYKEKLELVVATAPDIETLRAANSIIGTVEMDWDQYQSLDGTFVPPVSGLYYVAVHGCSDKGQNTIRVSDIHISAGINSRAPAKPEILGITPDSDGKLLATIDFKAPTTNLDGNPLKELAYLMIERDGAMVGAINNPEPGKEYSYTDQAPLNGMNEYSVRAVNNFGIGEPALASAYIGTVAPMYVGSFDFMYGENTGQAKIVWEPVTEDVEGHKLAEGDVTYTLMRSIGSGTLREVASGIKECSYTDQVMSADDPQAFVYYVVKAVAPGGESELSYSNIYPLGKPYDIPAHEPFSVSNNSGQIWTTETPYGSYTAWDVYDDSELPVSSFDGNGMALAFTQYQGEYNNQSSLFSGLFDLSKVSNPVLTFYYLDFGSKNTLSVRVNDGKKWTEVANVTTENLQNKWRKITVDLSAFKSQTICLEFLADNKEYNVLPIDNLRVTSDFNRNISALTISVPEKAYPNEEFTVEVKYENSAKEDIADYKVDLYCDNRLIDSRQGKNLKAATIGSQIFKVSLPGVANPNSVFKAVVSCQGDEFTDDDSTAEAIVKFATAVYPAPRDLKGESKDDFITLAWDEPDLNTMLINPRVEDVESYTPYSIGLPHSEVEGDDMGEWTVIDNDGFGTYAAGGELFTYPNMKKPAAFMVYNSYQAEDNVFACHSGHQMFVCLGGKDENSNYKNDDWLISPKLAGCAQTISFYTRSVTVSVFGPDTYEILYSTTGKEMDDFELLTQGETTGEWEEHEYELPEGTLYFAIRCVSSKQRYAMLVDDITLVTEHDVIKDLNLEGYNVYCNGVRLNENPLTEIAFTHSKLGSGKYEYQTTALYSTYGESAPSNLLEINLQSGLESVATGASILTRPGRIIISGAEGEKVAVYSVDGICLYSALAGSEVSVSVNTGVYLVSIGNSNYKVAVK